MVTQPKSIAKRPMNIVSITNGYWFYFQHESVEIAVHGSAWSGKETVYLNDNPVSEQRNLTSLNSKHQFRHEGKEYRVKFAVISTLRGELECHLEVDGELLSRQTKAWIEDLSTRDWILKLLPFFIVGLVSGFLTGYFFFF